MVVVGLALTLILDPPGMYIGAIALVLGAIFFLAAELVRPPEKK